MNGFANEAIKKSFDLWKGMIEKHDLSRLPEITHPDVVFRSPMAHSGYHSVDALVLALTNVDQVFQNFTYHRFFYTEDGLGVVLEFSASVGDKELKGVDLVQFNEEGKIVEFEVMVRPFSALQALGQEMGKRVGEALPEFKKG